MPEQCQVTYHPPWPFYPHPAWVDCIPYLRTNHVSHRLFVRNSIASSDSVTIRKINVCPCSRRSKIARLISKQGAFQNLYMQYASRLYLQKPYLCNISIGKHNESLHSTFQSSSESERVALDFRPQDFSYHDRRELFMTRGR